MTRASQILAAALFSLATFVLPIFASCQTAGPWTAEVEFIVDFRPERARLPYWSEKHRILQPKVSCSSESLQVLCETLERAWKHPDTKAWHSDGKGWPIWGHETPVTQRVKMLKDTGYQWIEDVASGELVEESYLIDLTDPVAYRLNVIQDWRYNAETNQLATTAHAIGYDPELERSGNRIPVQWFRNLGYIALTTTTSVEPEKCTPGELPSGDAPSIWWSQRMAIPLVQDIYGQPNMDTLSINQSQPIKRVIFQGLPELLYQQINRGHVAAYRKPDESQPLTLLAWQQMLTDTDTITSEDPATGELSQILIATTAEPMGLNHLRLRQQWRYDYKTGQLSIVTTHAELLLPVFGRESQQFKHFRSLGWVRFSEN